MSYFVVEVCPATLMRDDVDAARREAMQKVVDKFKQANGREPLGPVRRAGMNAPAEVPHLTYDGLTVRAHIQQAPITVPDPYM